jgi:PAS domain S-box-containing protein
VGAIAGPLREATAEALAGIDDCPHAVVLLLVDSESGDQAEVVAGTEAALLEGVAASIGHALERLRLAEERDRLYREAEERGKAARVIGSIADGVLLVDDAGIVRLWNPAAEAITGLAREVVVGRRLEHAIPQWAAIASSVVVANPSPYSSGHATAVPIDIDGRELWLSIRGVDFPEGTVYAFRDLTEGHRLEQLKADFIATVSHELRTPLAAVHGAAMTLQRKDVVPEGRCSTVCSW